MKMVKKQNKGEANVTYVYSNPGHQKDRETKLNESLAKLHVCAQGEDHVQIASCQ